MPHPHVEFGAYWSCQQSKQVAVIISKDKQHAKQQVDLLFESGQTVFDQDIAQFLDNYVYLFTDAQLILDGCSCNPGWEKARELQNKI